MLIRSQNKENLVNFNNVLTIKIDNNENEYRLHAYISNNMYVNIGTYDLKSSADKVLNMIEEKYQEPIYINDLGCEYAKYEHKVFQIPMEDEING